MKELSSRTLEVEDVEFLKEIITASPEWQQEECKAEELDFYLNSYKMYNGDWKIWNLGEMQVGVSYVLEWSPANEKPWIGTILIHQASRSQGLGRRILTEIGLELKHKGHKVLFAACPIKQDSWLQFLGKCEFEQFKVEKDETTSKEYMITLKPLS
ncbi:GNAT family N-acetyltransferase [uncultured Metabacillus sp.]|uniref:GNAT family N-acetyltransferase n=1 Tax=Metabacillus sp. Hm71 TaxID=3450743 RepID=UPI002601F39B|nr:GNAT family N-acetyltransferase [uncultured Metabacillus sp.]